MRVLHIVSSLNVGGAERFVIDLANEQKNAQQLDVTVLSMGVKGEPLESELENAQIEVLHAVKISDLRQTFKSFDVVHVHSSYCLLRTLIASLWLPNKVIYTRHNEVVHQDLKWKFTYYLASKCLHKIVFVAQKARDNFVERYPAYHPLTQTILNGVLPVEIERKTDFEDFRIGHVGRFIPLKSQHLLIEAVARLPQNLKERLSLIFFGTGPTRETNMAMAKSEIPEVKVTVVDFEKDRNKIYGSFDLLVVTSETEGLSLAIIEAMSSKIPVLATKVGGNPELVKDGINGSLYEYGDSQLLAQQIELMMENQSIYYQQGIKSRELYEESFSMTHCAQHYLNSYQ